MHARMHSRTQLIRRKGKSLLGLHKTLNRIQLHPQAPTFTLFCVPSSLPPSPLPEDKLFGLQAFFQSPETQKGAHCLYACSVSAKEKKNLFRHRYTAYTCTSLQPSLNVCLLKSPPAPPPPTLWKQIALSLRGVQSKNMSVDSHGLFCHKDELKYIMLTK